MDNAYLRILTAILALCFAINAQGTLTVTSRGVRSDGTAATWAVSPQSTIAAGTLGVLCLSFDNAGTGGATKILNSATIVDSVGNTWTRRLDFIYDPGAANAGIEVGVYTGVIVTQVTSTDTVSVTFSTNPTSKCAAWWEISASVGDEAYVTGAANCDGCSSGQTGTAATITSGTIVVSDAIVGIMAAENVGTMTGDTDTTNGSWNSQQSTTQGSGTSGTKIASQVKLQTTTDSTQTYDVTLGTSSDWQTAWIQVHESTTSIKTVMGLANASVKTVNDLVRASVKAIMDLP